MRVQVLRFKCFNNRRQRRL